MKIYERACAKTSQIARETGFFRLTAEQLDLPFQGHRCTWRSWAYLKLQCLCARLRIGVVETHSDVNSWSSRSPSSEHPLLPCLSTHFWRSDGRGMEMTFTSHWVLRKCKDLLFPHSKKYSSLYLPPLVIQSGESNLGYSSRLSFSIPVDWRTGRPRNRLKGDGGRRCWM
jgi:hypothetical protein